MPGSLLLQPGCPLKVLSPELLLVLQGAGEGHSAKNSTHFSPLGEGQC